MQNNNTKNQINATRELANQVLTQATTAAKAQVKRLQVEAEGQAKKIHAAVASDVKANADQVLAFVFDKAINVGEAQLGKIKSLRDKLKK